MSIKDLFEKSHKQHQNLDESDINSDAESQQRVDAVLQEQDRYVVSVDYSSASNFARYGLAEEYYANSVDRITQQWPYDGSEAERQEFINQSRELDLFVFNEKYPRTTGYVTLSSNNISWSSTIKGYGVPATNEYIEIRGGPHTASEGMLGKPLYQTFTGSNYYDESIYDGGFDFGGSRLSNLRTYLSGGVTIEFWLKKQAWDLSNTKKEVIFDLWNGHASSSADYGRLTLEISGTATTNESPFVLTCMSGTSGFAEQQIGSNITTSSVSDWTHVAVSLLNEGAAIRTMFYVNGDLNESKTIGTSLGDITGSLNAYIGSLRTAPSGNVYEAVDASAANLWRGRGRLSASLDEFRFWKTQRSSKEIGRSWFTNYAGGTNTDLSNTTLGVYYKFNEGITGTSSVDSMVLDYSGRLSNGLWYGYAAGSRNTGSAMVSASAGTEFEEPIIYGFHEDVTKLRELLVSSGSLWDDFNNSNLYGSLPSWVTEEDRESGQHIRQITQIMSSYFDTLQLQIDSLPKITNMGYPSGSNKPTVYARNLLVNHGLDAPDLFLNASLMNIISNRDEDRNYQERLLDVKNHIYNNIYNSIYSIYRSKGTINSLRNMLHCFGIDEKLVNINVYSNNSSYELKDNFRTIAVKKKYANFNDPDRYDSTIYQQTSSLEPDTVSFISGTNQVGYETEMGMTAQVEAIFPIKKTPDQIGYQSVPFLTASIFGMHTADGDSATDFAYASPDVSNFQLYAIRPELNSTSVRFMLSSSTPFPVAQLTSSLYEEVYGGNRWNFSIRVRPYKYPLTNDVTGSDITSYVVEFHGVNMVGGSAINEFLLTSSMSQTQGEGFLKSAKRFYAGAHRQNFTASLVDWQNNAHDALTDISIASVRYWPSYLEQDVIDSHARDPDKHGVRNPYKSAHLTDNIHIPQLKTLALNWDFSQVTSSDDGGVDGLGVDGSSNAGFFVKDISSGSAVMRDRWDWIGGVIGNKHGARASYYMPNDTGSVNNDYIFSYRQNLPESMQSSDMVNILRDDDNQFTRESSPVSHYFSIEKSMYRTISEEMLKMFATIVEFNNIIGEPVNRYRQEYKSMEKLRSLFFERMQNEPDLDKYMSFYRWIDASISTFLLQLIPASAETSGEIRTMVESHLLERNKYWTKFPTLESKAGDPTAGLRGVNELLYDWEHGHKNPDGAERDNALYWRDRALRADAPLSSSNADVNSNKETVRNISGKHRNDTPPTLYDTATATTYQGSAYAIDRFTKPYRLATHESREIKGGVNFPRNKKANLVYDAVRPHGPRSDGQQANIPLNVMLAQSSSVEAMPEISDRIDPLMKDSDAVVGPLKTPAVNEKRRFNFEVMQGRDFCVDYAGIAKDNLLFPFNIHSSSAPGGYNEEVTCGFYQGAELTNLHHDTYGEGHEVPMQGPFTEKWVGGHQSRHVELNVGSDNQLSRPEAFRIVTGDCKTGGFIGIIGADYPFPEGDCEVSGGFPVKKYPRASMYREVTAKRPVNIAYIKQTGSAKGVTSIGNYEYIYQALQASSRATQRRAFVKTEGAALFASASAWVSGTVDYTKLDHASRASKHVFVERFSAPGGPETSGDANGGFGLDAVSGEYSPYNSLNNRNLLVRSTMRELFRAHTNAFGYSGYTNSLVAEVEVNQSDYSGRANYHKVHRNNLDRMTQQESYVAVYSGSALTNTSHIHFPDTDLDSGSCFALASYNAAGDALTESEDYLNNIYSAYSATGFSYSGWIKPMDTSVPDGGMYLFSFGRAGSLPAMWAEIDRNPNTADGVERIMFGIGSTTDGQGANGHTTWEVKATSSFLREWAHVAITWTSQASGTLGSANTGEGQAMEAACTIYINGVSASTDFTMSRPFSSRRNYLEQTSMTAHSNLKDFANLDYEGRRLFFIGADWKDHYKPFSGSMDELTFWKIPLDSNQVTELYNRGIPCDVTASSLYAATGSNMLDWVRFEHGLALNQIVIDSDNPGAYVEGTNYLHTFTNKKFFPVAISGSDNNAYTASAEIQGCSKQFDRMDRQLTYTTASVQDNYYVFHTIPRAEHQYSWLTASLLPNTEKFLGFAPTDGMITNSSGYVAALDFVSSSEVGTHYPGNNVANGRIFGNDHDVGKVGHLPTDFVGMNHNIYEPISSSANTVGYDSMTTTDLVGGNAAGYNNYLNVSHVVRNTFGGENVFNSSSAGGPRDAMILNSLLLHRNGPYGYPTWKQIRTADHPVARYNRRNNIISTFDAPTQYTTDDGRVFVDSIRPSTFINYEEPPVGSSQYPILANLQGSIIQTTYGTNLVYFNNVTLNERLGLSITDDIENQSYTNLLAMYGATPSGFQTSITPMSSYGLVYREQVYPKDRYAFTSAVRKRESFYVSFWTPLDEDRRVTHLINSQGEMTRTGSIWGMDGPSDTYWNSMRLPREYDGGSTTTYLAGEIYSIKRISSGSGELQDISKQLWGNYDSAGNHLTFKRGGPLYYHFNTHYTASANLSPSNGFSDEQLTKWGFNRTDMELAVTPIFGGHTKFEAHVQAGRAPFYQSYDEYVEDLRLKGKDHTIVPEFRMSEHIPFYMLEQGGNFFAENTGSLTLTGSAASMNASDDDGFYRTYAHAEFMRHFDRIESDHEFDGGVRGLTLKCKAQMKLLPYDGFFPMHRTIQLAELFSQSYGPNIIDAEQFRQQGSDFRAFPSSSSPQAQKDRWAIWCRPFMAPGILYNTIKSGMAVDYPIMTASWNKKFKGSSGDFKISASYEAHGNLGSREYGVLEKYEPAVGYRYNMGTRNNATGSFFEPTSNLGYKYDVTAMSGAIVQMDDYNIRLPFEAIIDPAEYVRGQPIADSGHTSSQPGFGVQDGQPFARRGMLGPSNKPLYKMAMSNFLASVPEFFLDDRNFSTITSTTEDRFLDATPGKVYGALVRIRKSVDTATTASHGYHSDSLSRVMAINPNNTTHYVPDQSEEVIPWTTHKETMTMYSRPSAFGPAHGWGSFAGYNTPFTPSYYDGEGWAVLYWTPPTGSDFGKNKLASRKYSLDEIMANLDIMYLRHGSMLNTNRFVQISSSEGSGFGGLGTVPIASSLENTYNSVLQNGDLERLGLSSEMGRDVTHTNASASTGASIMTQWKVNYPFPQTGSHLYNPESNAMQVSASLNLTLKAGVASPTYDPETGQITSAQFDQNSDTKVWAIQAKFETPMLNFKDVDASMPTSYKGTDWGGDPLDAPPSSSVAKGMWHQYGRLPTEDEGIFMQIGDIPEPCKNAWSYSPTTDGSSSAGVPVFGYFHTASNPSYTDSKTFQTLSSLFKDFTNPAGPTSTYQFTWDGDTHSLKREGRILPEQWESLCDLVGFPKASKKMGQIADSQEIKEAVVAIPFVEHEGERQFFEIPRETIDKAGRIIDGTAVQSFQDQTLEPGGSVVDMVRRMRNYIFPPKMDFLTNDALNPFAMYIFEFSYELNQQDLSDIWQNILPEHGTRIKESTATISHTLLEEQLSGQNQQLLGWRAAVSGKRIPSNLQWLVFKVKQRGEFDYYAKVFGSDAQESSATQGGLQKRLSAFANIGGSSALTNNEPLKYSYNWPYDYCSVVELASLETAVSYGGNEITGYDPPPPDFTTPTGELTTILDSTATSDNLASAATAATSIVQTALNSNTDDE